MLTSMLLTDVGDEIFTKMRPERDVLVMHLVGKF